VVSSTKTAHLKVVLDAVHLMIAFWPSLGAFFIRGDHHMERVPGGGLVFGHERALSSSGVHQPAWREKKKRVNNK